MLSDLFLECITSEAIAFSRVFFPVLVLVIVFRLVQITIWGGWR